MDEDELRLQAAKSLSPSHQGRPSVLCFQQLVIAKMGLKLVDTGVPAGGTVRSEMST